MTTVYLSPIGNAWQFFGSDGLPLNAGKLYTYAAGTTTPQATYTTNAGSVQNANPIILNADGRLPNEVWLTSDAYRFDLKDSTDNLLGSYDNISGVNNVSTELFTLSSVAGTNTITAVASPAITSYTAGTIFLFVPASTNSSAATLNISSLGAKNIFAVGAALVGGELVSGVPVLVEYDGTQFNILGPSFTAPTPNAGTNTTRVATTAFVMTQTKGLGAVHYYTSSTTWTKPSNLIAARVIVVGAGGGSGGHGIVNASEAAGSGGGGAGGTAIAFIAAGSLSATETVTVGAAGTAGASGVNTGGTGGDSSFGAHATAHGGVGGAGGSSQSTVGPCTSGTGGVGGTASGGDVNITGGTGGQGLCFATGGAVGGSGGDSLTGAGGRQSGGTASGIGSTGTGYGSGASGAWGGSSQGASAGSAGTGGIVIVEEFY